MKKRLLPFSLLYFISIFLNAQNSYSTDVVYLGGTDQMITLRTTGTHEKKKSASEMALQSAFNMLFYNGVEGFMNGKALVEKDNKHYIETFFNQRRYMIFITNYSEEGDPQKMPNKHYKSTVRVNILTSQLVNDLVRNQLMSKPIDKISMEETEEEIGLPSIMVVPYKKDGETYKNILQNDFDRRMAVGKVRSGFNERGVTTIDIEGKAFATNRSMEFESNTADSNDKQLITNSGADVYVIVDLKKDYSPNGNRVALSMTAYETSSGNILATRQGWSNRFNTNSLDQLCVYAVKDQLSPFLNDISKSFANKIVKGNSVVLKLSVASTSMMTMNSTISGKSSLGNEVRQWVRKNSHNGRYHIQGMVDESMIFDNIQIPAKDIDGLPMDPSQFAYNLTDYIKNNLQTNISPDSPKIDGSTIYITIE